MANGQGFGGQMNPVQAAGQPPKSPEEFQALRGRWMEILTAPETQAALLQFSASVLQPVGRGQSALGNIGLALADAGGAIGRVQARQVEREQQERENAQRERQITATEQATTESGRAARASEGLRGRQLQQEGEQFQQSLLIKLEELGIEKSRSAAYAASIARVAGSDSPRDKMLLQAFKLLGQEAADAALTGDEEFDYDTRAGQLSSAIDALLGTSTPASSGTDAGFDKFLDTLTGGDATKKQTILDDSEALAEAKALFAGGNKTGGVEREVPVAPGTPGVPTTPSQTDARLAEIVALVKQEWLGPRGRRPNASEGDIVAEARRRLALPGAQQSKKPPRGF